MILEAETVIEYGYLAIDLPPHSEKPILAACNGCGNVRETSKKDYCSLCRSCASKSEYLSDKSIAKMSDAHKGIKNYNFGKEFTDEHKANLSAAHVGKKRTKESRANQSASLKGKYVGEKNPMFGRTGATNPAWLNGISFEPYCIKFNGEYKEHIRDLFSNECFLCSKSAKENGEALCVHHKDYNKQCSCDGTVCACVPLCRSCHTTTNYDRDFWQALITEMLQPVEAWM